MYTLTKLALVAATLVAPLVGATSDSSSELVERQAAGQWWFGEASLHNGKVPSNDQYVVYRNVKDFGAVGDGVADDSAAINKAISEDKSASNGERCGLGCNSTTTQPAVVYFPPGKYRVKQTIIQYYHTQLVGDAANKPTIIADASLKAMGVIDADPYGDGGKNWYTNQNNFYRQIRNLKLDLTEADETIAGIHWQVAQATSLTNLDFAMRKGSKQLGIFMDNGSGGWMSELTFDGGLYGAFLGSQQFTTRNLKCTNTDTCIFMNWNWLWTLKSLDIDSSNKYGINMSVNDAANGQSVGSVLVQDSTIAPSVAGIVTAFDINKKQSNGSIILDNVAFGSGETIVNTDGAPVPAAPAKGQVAQSWVQGSVYTTGATNGTSNSGQQWVQETLPGWNKPQSLLDNGKIAEVPKPQYETVSAANIVNVKDKGAKGDGKTDDTAALQAVFDSATPDQVVFLPFGHYLLGDTLKITKSVNIVGELWAVLLADGSKFNDQSNPKVVIQVGEKTGSTAAIQMSDLVVSTKGPAAGAILMEWNTKGSGQAGSAGMWDVHWRIGGFTGTELQSSNCARAAPLAEQPTSPDCIAAFLMFHMTAEGSGYFENVWWWVADHELDLPGESQINVYNGRGVLIESQGPAWLYGTASEHSQFYNYAFNGAKDIYIGATQTETSYMSGGAGPLADSVFKFNKDFADPDFKTDCANDNTNTCSMTWGMRFTDSSDIAVFGAGLYSFFNVYSQKCLKSGGGSDNCQRDMVFVDQCSSDVYLYGLTTKASVNMVTFAGQESGILGEENPSTFGDTAALVEIA